MTSTVNLFVLKVPAVLISLIYDYLNEVCNRGVCKWWKRIYFSKSRSNV